MHSHFRSLVWCLSLAVIVCVLAAPRVVLGAGPVLVAQAGQRTVSLDVKNADILDVLKLLAQQSGQNIIATSGVKGTVTVSLQNVPLRTALDLVVRASGLQYRQIGNIYVVGPPEDLTKQFGATGAVAAQTVAFPIKYAKPDDLGKQLATVLPPNSFIVDARTNTLIVSGTSDVIQAARNFLALADVAAPQVLFEVKVLDITRSNGANAGINWTGNSAICLFELAPPTTPTGTCPPTSFIAPVPIAPQPFVRTGIQVAGIINYLITHNEAQLLADPRVAALDNQDASILVGQTFPLVYFDPKAGTFQAQFIDIGVRLNVSPTINTDGFVTTKLHVERSVISGFVQQFPILNNRKIDNVLRVKDGDTIVMGGLMDDETLEDITKIPLLGDIPVFGAIFRNKKRSITHNEVVFLITPHVLKER